MTNDPEQKTGMGKDIRLLREISILRDMLYPNARDLGDYAAVAFRDLSKARRNTNTHRSQMTGLENIADSALSVSDILDFIKKQIARFEYWRMVPPRKDKDKEMPKEGFGETLKNFIEGEIAQRRDNVCVVVGVGNETNEDAYRRQQIYLQIIRQFIRQLVVQYEYRASWEEKGAGGHGANAGAGAQSPRAK